MASPPRPEAQHLDFLAGAAPDAKHWGLFALVRSAEARAQEWPLVGRALRPSQNIVDLTQEPSLGFAPSTLHTIESAHARMRISGYWLGLTGPMGPLPTHLSEYASYEARYAKKRPFGRFLDLLAGRMLQLFYRAWANAQPAAMADRPEHDAFAMYLSALTGATEGVRPNAAFPAKARLHYAALFASRRTATGIEDALTHLLRQPVKLIQNRPLWCAIEADQQTRLGHSFATLGRDALVGARVLSAADAFRVVVRAASIRDYQSLLPTGQRYPIATEALNAFAPTHLEWDIAVEIAQSDAPPARLDGRAQLGWTSWVGRGSAPMRCDAHLRRQNTKHFKRWGSAA